jgi:hypothetical protein
MALLSLVGWATVKNEAMDSSEILAAINTQHRVASPKRVSYQPTTRRTLARKCVSYEKII